MASWRAQLWLTTIVVALCLSSVACSDGGPKSIRIGSAHLTDPGTLELSLETCQAKGLVIHTTETANKVTVKVTADKTTARACAELQSTKLASPLGDRELIDAATGKTVTIFP